MSELETALRELRTRLDGGHLPLDLADTEPARRTQTELQDQIDDYLLARLARLDAPLLAVIGGSTGAGKSTITNSLVGANLSVAGVLRPTTRTPVLVCHPDDRSWFAEDNVLPELARSTGTRPTGSGLHLSTSPTVPRGLGILDAPDIDSVEAANHDLAAQLLGAADVWLFVTTAARYADAVPWEYLTRARERSVALAVVVNRVPAGASDEVGEHLREMLRDHGLREAPVFTITEAPLIDGRLGADAMSETQRWIEGLVADADAREALVRSTLAGAIASVPERTARVSAAMAAQTSVGRALETLSLHHYDEALHHLAAELDSGTLLRGEVLERWREHVGTGELMDRLQRGVGRLRDRIKSVLTGSEPPSEAAQGELESNLEILIRQVADQAALDTAEGWDALPGGRQLLGAGPRGLDRASGDLRERASREIAAWEGHVLDLIRDQAGNRLAVARTLSLGINGVGVALMVTVFSSTGGITGGEAGIAAGTAAVSQTVLSAVFGEQAVRTLARQAREDLELRLAGLFEDERLRFDALLDVVPTSEESAALDQAALAVARAEW